MEHVAFLIKTTNPAIPMKVNSNSHLSLKNPTPTHSLSTFKSSYRAPLLYNYLFKPTFNNKFPCNSVTGISFLIAYLKAVVTETH